jgi:ubiquinone/menaquinone biosynthesis C-methylase UbiE
MNYLMESQDEIERLERKTSFKAVEMQSRWAGLKEGMRVADIGCGSGRTSSFLKKITGEKGEVVGIDLSTERLDYARKTYGSETLTFIEKNIYHSMEDLGKFDFIWVRFLLEYHREEQFQLVRSFSEMLAPGGILCLIDLDHNSLNHYRLTPRMEKAISESMDSLVEHSDFDPYAGRRLYSYMYDLELKNIDVNIGTHHLIFGDLNETDSYNWFKKITVGLGNSKYTFPDYPGGFEEFAKECNDFISDPRRFIYTPIICCRGVKST